MCTCVYICIHVRIYIVCVLCVRVCVWGGVRGHLCMCVCDVAIIAYSITLQYKEAYDRELVQHGNTMQELVMVKQRLETEQESLAEADEAVRTAEAKLAANDVSIGSCDVSVASCDISSVSNRQSF